MLERFDVGMESATRQRLVETCCEGRLHEATLSENSRVVPLGTYSRRVRVEFLMNFSGAKARHWCSKALRSADAAAAASASGLNAAKARTTRRSRGMWKERRELGEKKLNETIFSRNSYAKVKRSGRKKVDGHHENIE